MIWCMLLTDLREMGSGPIFRHALLVCSYKPIPVGLATSGSITACFTRSCSSSTLSAVSGSLRYRRREPQDVQWLFERHPIKAVAAFAVFIKHVASCIKGVHAGSDMREVILTVIEIPTSSLSKCLPKRLILSNPTSLEHGDGPSISSLMLRGLLVHVPKKLRGKTLRAIVPLSV